MNGTPLQLTLRETRRHFSDPRTLAGMGIVALVLGMSGPFGTFAKLPLLPLLAYWAAIVVLTYAGGFLAAAYIEHRGVRRLPRWARIVVTGLPSGVVATIAVVAINAVTFGPGAMNPGEIGILFLNSILVALAVIAISMLIASAIRARNPAMAATATPPAILARIPLPQRGTLLALSVEDHYVDVITDRGKSLVLMRLADAMRETGSVEGLQIHRSHWVARAAVVRAHKSAGKLVLELSNGLKLPVSRGFLAEVRAAGLTM
ncbi:MAG: LytTR family DNA-binding domain-containing protein [Devosia sp.]